MHRRDFSSEAEDDEENQRCDGDDAKREDHVNREKVHGGREEQGHRFHDAADDPGDVVPHGIQVAGHAGHQVAGPVGAVKLHVLALNLIVKEIPNPEQRALRNPLVSHAVQINDDDAEQCKAHHQGNQRVDGVLLVAQGKIVLLRVLKQSDQFSRKMRHYQLQDIVQGGTKQRDDKQRMPSLHVLPQPAEP